MRERKGMLEAEIKHDSFVSRGRPDPHRSRDAGYDPKLDAIVRTEAVRLRARLEKYYAGEGSRDANLHGSLLGRR